MSIIVEFLNSIRQFFYDIRLTVLTYILVFILISLCIFMLKKIFQFAFIVFALLYALTCYKETFKFIASPLLKNYQVVSYRSSENKKIKESTFLTNNYLPSCNKIYQTLVILGIKLHHSAIPSLIGQDRIFTAIELLERGHIQKKGGYIVFTGAINEKFFYENVWRKSKWI